MQRTGYFQDLIHLIPRIGCNDPYLLIQTCRSGYKVGEVPVAKRYHDEMKDNTKMVIGKVGGPFSAFLSLRIKS